MVKRFCVYDLFATSSLTQSVIVTLIVCAVISPIALHAHPTKVYKLPEIADVATTRGRSITIPLNGRSIKFTLMYQSQQGRPLLQIYRSHRPSFVERIVKQSSAAMDDYLRLKGVRVKDCRGTLYNLIIIIVDRSILSDPARFRGHLKTPYPRGQTLYGYYSSTPRIERNSTILVTDIGRHINEEVLAHEMAHYWWDRLCITSHVKGSSEQFAQEFDDYFVNWVKR